MKTQSQRIKEHLLKGKTLTPLQALNKFGCFRLSARIYDLKDELWDLGYVITSVLETKNDKTFAKYSLKAFKKQKDCVLIA